MAFWKRMEEFFFTGKVLKDYGIIYKHQPFSWWTVEYRVLLTEKKGEKRLVIKQNSGVKREMNVSYHEFDVNGVKRLKEILDDILRSDPESCSNHTRVRS